MTEINQEKLVDACRRLVRGMEQPEPGLLMWHMIMGQIADEIREAVGQGALTKIEQERSAVNASALTWLIIHARKIDSSLDVDAKDALLRVLSDHAELAQREK